MVSAFVHAIGTPVWVADEQKIWVKGVVKEVGEMLVVATDGGERRVAPASAPLQNKDGEPVDDMTDLAFLHEPGVLWNLKQRYSSSNIYTYTGGILIAVNPFQHLPDLYSRRVMDMYSTGDTGGLAPHVYAIASAAYKKMINEGKGQAILVTGESGAGKTETSKLIMRYLAYLGGFKQSCWDLAAAAAAEEEAAAAAANTSSSSSSIEQKVLESNPLLEAFGNAKTVRNDNSSRFGKYVEINFNKRGAISGAAVKTYLLERSRLVHLNPGERNYHIFYQLCDGATADERARWLLNDRSSYAYLNQSDVYDLPGTCNKSEFSHTRHAMSAIGITVQQQEAVFRVLSALLHLGNVTWTESSSSSSSSSSSGGGGGTTAGLCNGTAEAAAAAAGSGGCPLAPGSEAPAALAAAARLLGVEVQGLARALSTRTRITPDGPITSPLDPHAAASNRDALVKVIYARLFDWLVAKINGSIGQDPQPLASIGLLDIYGFESFQFNDLEQFCINLANEKLQQHFNQHVFKWEQAEYESEGIDWSYIEFVDNQDVLELIEGKLGLVDLLDEQCRFPTATYKDLADKLFSAPQVTSSARFSRTKRSTTAFTLNHYAGPVSYSCDNFLDKNRDFVVAEHQSLMGGAQMDLLSEELFGSSSSSSSGGGGSSGGGADAPAQNSRTAAALSGKSLKAFQFVSVCSLFKRQLTELMALLNQLEPQYVRCIKPNAQNKPLLLDDGYALHQLKCGGVMEAVRISCAGYPFRRTFAEFLEQFWQLYPPGRAAAAAAGSDPAAAAAAACRQLLANTGMSEGADYQVGHTKVFLKSHQSAYLNKLHTQALAVAATKIQAAWRCFAARTHYARQRAAIITIQAGTRGMFGRRKAAAVRQERAATLFQTLWRGIAARSDYRQQQQAAVVMQSVIRGLVAHKAYQQMLFERRAAAATILQAAWRGLAARQAYQQSVSAVVRLQAAWRAAAARQQYRELLQQYRLQLQQYNAAVCIQHCWRSYQQRKQGDRFRCDAAAEAAAVVIQQIWRERDQHNSKVRRLQQAVRQYTALHQAVHLVQSAWRRQQALQQLKKLQNQQRRARFEAQRLMFEQQMAAAFQQHQQQQQQQGLSRSNSNRGSSESDSTTVSPRAAWPAQQGAMPPPLKATYGVTFAGLQGLLPRSSAAAAAASEPGTAPPRPQATTTAKFKLRPLPPPPPAAYGVSYSGINGDINPLNPGERLNQGDGTKPRNFRVFQPAPAAAYGVAFAGISGGGSSSSSSHGGSSATVPTTTGDASSTTSSMRARLLEPAPPAAYGLSYNGLPATNGSSSNSSSSDAYLAGSSSSSSNSSSGAVSMYRTPSAGGGSSRLFSGLRSLGSSASIGSSSSSSPGRRAYGKQLSCSGYLNGDVEAESAPLLLDVVKCDESALLPPEDRLFQRLGSLVEEKGRVNNLVSGWRDRLLSR